MLESINTAIQLIVIKLTGPDRIWYMVGFLGQLIFFTRFLVQWIVSEREGKSVIPVHFWFISIAGSLTLLTYATWQLDPVIMAGQSCGSFIYFRNLMLLSRERREAAERQSAT